MKTIIIYYSLSGNSRIIAELIKTATNADVLQLEVQGENYRTGFLKRMRSIARIMTHKKLSLKPYTVNPAQYDLLILGGPVWAGSLVPVLTAFLEQTGITGKKIALFCCHASEKETALEKIIPRLANNTIVGKIDFAHPSKQDKQALTDKITDWIETISKQ